MLLFLITLNQRVVGSSPTRPTTPHWRICPLPQTLRRSKDMAMQWFRDLKTVTKLLVGFALMGAIMAGIGYLGIHYMGRIHTSVQEVYEQHLLAIKTIAEAR